MFQSRTLVGLDRKLSNVKRGEQGTCSSEICVEGALSFSLDIRAQNACPFPTSLLFPEAVISEPRSSCITSHHLPDPDLVDNLIPVVGQEGPHIGQEGSCQETVSHQVAQILLQALEDSRGGRCKSSWAPVLEAHGQLQRHSPLWTLSISEGVFPSPKSLCPKNSALLS